MALESDKIKEDPLLYPTSYLWPEKGPVGRWSPPFRLFSNVARRIHKLDNTQVKSEVAWEIDRYWLQRRTRNSLKTITGLNKAMEIASTYYPALKEPGIIALDKQQPSLIRAVEETIKRLQFLTEYVPSLPIAVLSCISGGSMSYGRFFNIRGAENNPSDLDLVLIFENEHLNELTASDILPERLNFNATDQKLLDERISIFKELVRSGKAEMISQKSTLDTLGFDVSMHIMSRKTFNNTMLYGVVQDTQTMKDVDVRLLDYKPHPFKYQVMKQKDFNGDIHEFRAEETLVRGGATMDEVVSRIPAYAIKKGNYIPGVYQNLVSPRFEFEPYTSPLISSAVTMYWALMQDLVKDAKRRNPHASVLKSHIRYEIFSTMLKLKYE